MRTPTGSLLLSSCALGAWLAAMPARADGPDTQTVTLTDGTTVTGDVVEYVANDHVILRLPTGETRRIEWSQLATPAHAPPVAGGAAASPSPMAPATDATTLAPTPLAPALPEPAAPDAFAPSPPPDPGRAPLDELRPAFERDPTTGMSSSFSLGAQTGYAAPTGYLAFVADYFPFRLPALRWLGVELTAAMPVVDRPFTIGEGLLFEWGLGGLAYGFGAAFLQSFAPSIVPGDRPGIISTVAFDLSHMTVHLTRQLSVRARWGLALFINGDYCTAHPEACPQLGSLPSFNGDLAVLWTFDLGRTRPDLTN